MNLSQLQLTNPNVNKAVAEIIARLKTLVDNTAPTPVKVLQSVSKGIELPTTNIMPQSVVPAARLWYDRSRYPIQSADMVPWRKYVEIDLFIYVYSEAAQNGTVDIQGQLASLMWAIVLWFQDSDDKADKFSHSKFWWFDMEQNIEEVYHDIYRKLGGSDTLRYNEALQPPYYASRLTFGIYVHDFATS